MSVMEAFDPEKKEFLSLAGEKRKRFSFSN